LTALLSPYAIRGAIDFGTVFQDVSVRNLEILGKELLTMSLVGLKRFDSFEPCLRKFFAVAASNFHTWRGVR
jgi:hypothetical protein